jgi:hypothetical protein
MESSGGLHYTRDATDSVEEPGLSYSNPHSQRVGPRWAKEYVVVYSVDGGPDGRPARVPGQYGIYESTPRRLSCSPSRFAATKSKLALSMARWR